MGRGTMEPLIRLFLLSLCFGGSLAGQPRLSQASPSHVVGETVPRLLCRMSGSDVASHVLSWYHQAPGRGPVFLLSHRAGEPRPSYGPGVSERFLAGLERASNAFSLTIGNPQPGDAGTYYCAVWYAGQYVFGDGTRLLFAGGAGRPREPRVALLGPAGGQRPAFLCVAWGFWPAPARLRWRLGGREPGSGEAAPPVEGRDGASAASSLSLPPQAWRDGARVACRVEHETGAQERSAELKGIGRRGCPVSTGDGNGTAGDAAPWSTGAPGLGRILRTARHCYLGVLAASCLASLGVSLLLARRGRGGQPRPRRPGPPPPPPGARLSVRDERGFE